MAEDSTRTFTGRPRKERMPCGWVAGDGNGQILCHTGRTRGLRQSSISRDLSRVPGQPSERATDTFSKRKRPTPASSTTLQRTWFNFAGPPGRRIHLSGGIHACMHIPRKCTWMDRSHVWVGLFFACNEKLPTMQVERTRWSNAKMPLARDRTGQDRMPDATRCRS